jgi:RNA polymerase sigma-70 factor (ECF subfamily)
MYPVDRIISDEELALEAQAGSRRCFEELTERYSAKLFHFLKQKIASDQDIEDILQETFFKLYRNILRYDPKWNFSTWIYTAANRLAISHYRSKHNKITLPLTQDPVSAIPNDSPQNFPHKNIWEKARGLKSVYYEALWLRYVEDMSSKEMARVMKRSDVAVRLLLHRARLNLAKKLESDGNYADNPSRSRWNSGASNLQVTENKR